MLHFNSKSSSEGFDFILGAVITKFSSLNKLQYTTAPYKPNINFTSPTQIFAVL